MAERFGGLINSETEEAELCYLVDAHLSLGESLFSFPFSIAGVDQLILASRRRNE